MRLSGSSGWSAAATVVGGHRADGRLIETSRTIDLDVLKNVEDMVGYFDILEPNNFAKPN